MYKLPKLADSSHHCVKDGVGYLYLDADDKQWKLSDKCVNQAKHPVYNTLQQVYDSYTSKVCLQQHMD